MDTMHYRFMQRLKHAMAREKVTQVGLAQRIGAQQSLVSRWLKGAWPSVPRLADIAVALNVTTDWLVGLSERERPDAEQS